MNNIELVAGSKVYRTKGAVRHVGVALSGGRILHITPSAGVELTDLRGFSEGKKVSYNLPLANVDVWALEQRAAELLAKGPAYQWWAFNCEHLASYVQTGKKVSGQLRAGLIGMASHLVLSKKPNVVGALLYVGVVLLTERAMHSAKKVSMYQ